MSRYCSINGNPMRCSKCGDTKIVYVDTDMWGWPYWCENCDPDKIPWLKGRAPKPLPQPSRWQRFKQWVKR